MGNEPGIGGAGLPDTPALPCVMPRSIAADTRKMFYRSNAPEEGNRRFWHRKLFRENYSRRQRTRANTRSSAAEITNATAGKQLPLTRRPVAPRDEPHLSLPVKLARISPGPAWEGPSRGQAPGGSVLTQNRAALRVAAGEASGSKSTRFSLLWGNLGHLAPCLAAC